MKQKFILLDIDNTLYDSSSFRKKLFEKVIKILEKLGCKDGEKLCDEVYSRLIKEKGLFYPEDFIEALQLQVVDTPLPKEQLLHSMYDGSFASAYLYAETHAIVKEFKKIGELGIFSQGMEKFQRLKVKQIAHLFKDHHVHIVPNKLSEFSKIFETYNKYDFFFLDDSLPILHAAKKAYPDIFTVWVKRGRYAMKQEPISNFIPDATVLTLKEAERILRKK